MNDFEGLVAVVTGGASGIGLATALRLVEQGATVAILDLDPTDVPRPLTGYRANVSDRVSVESAIESVVAAHGGIDVLVNNAGIGAVGTVADNSDEEWARVLDVNVVGIARVTAAALPALRRSRAASVVNVCSIAALNGLPDRALYSASKGAVLALTFAMAADHVREGIRINCVSPATVQTPWVDRLLQSAVDPEAELRALGDRQPTGRLVTAQEVADAICYLANPRSGSTTGTALAVDAGIHHLRLRPVAAP